MSKTWTQKEIEQKVLAAFNGKLDKSESSATTGPFRIGRYNVWQVWTVANGWYHDHYAAAISRNEPELFENFQPFALWASDQANEYRIIWARTLVAILVVCAALLLLGYLVVVQKQVVSASYLLTTVVGTAVAYLLGDRIIGDRLRKN